MKALIKLFSLVLLSCASRHLPKTSMIFNLDGTSIVTTLYKDSATTVYLTKDGELINKVTIKK